VPPVCRVAGAVCSRSGNGERRRSRFIWCIGEPSPNTTFDLRTHSPSGSREAFDLIVARAYRELRGIAHGRLARHGHGTLSTTTLVHETYLRLVDQSRAEWENHAHFLALASRAMRYVLVDRARARQALKRGGADRPVTFDDEQIGADEQASILLDLHEALESLTESEPRLACVVDCRFFGGLTELETAEAVGVTVRTVQRDWLKARVLLRHALGF